jgi:hypothetical protein
MNKYDFLNFAFQYMDVIYDSLLHDTLENSLKLVHDRVEDFQLALTFACSQSRFDAKDPSPAHELFTKHVGSLPRSQLGVCATFHVFCSCFFLHVSDATLKNGCADFSKLWVRCLQTALRTKEAEDQEQGLVQQKYYQQHSELRDKGDPIGLEEMVFGPKYQTGRYVD